jgi:hypothetical protein
MAVAPRWRRPIVRDRAAITRRWEVGPQYGEQFEARRAPVGQTSERAGRVGSLDAGGPALAGDQVNNVILHEEESPTRAALTGDRAGAANRAVGAGQSGRR